MRGLFVTATDTGVGKTEVACAILRNARAAGLDVIGMKPAQSGHDPGEPSDADRLRAACDGAEPLEVICPYTFAAPLAPAVAARVEGKTVSLARIVDAARALAARHEAVLVEGAGGLLVPLTERETYADLARALGLAALVVARAGLGTVNHVALTVEALRARRIPLAGIVLNRTVAEDDPSVPHNVAEIARLTGCEPLATLPFVRDIAERASIVRSRLAGKIQF
ncbi:dethiobiotin synthase [Anaeromyxobacter oryzae]|uniref:ATP-dependent dethiobiotin synthetase BioD n=1 Tax=Anaeromyxobacter oryzae TaxID=2918170 RepID=A0ABN6MUQ9_9BACT|nr:dethiobiotin synthase [Anaeromyxobacter oryzae]BDG03592.1 ATP-dependent dethiobiotin synthetase BioD [Anaeromyxobacter oryzae]